MPDLDYALNPYLGCYHACTYCYARLYTRIREVSENWGEVVAVKTNIVEVLKKEAPSKPRGVVGLGTITDAYQPVEATYLLSRRSLEVLLPLGFRVSIQTKNPLVTRDVDVLAAYKDRVDVGFTITTLDNKVASFIEPRAPPPSERASALKHLSERGVKTWLFYGPIIPGLNDGEDNIEALLKLAESTRSDFYYDSLHVKPFMSGGHVLAPYANRASSYDWRGLFNYIESKCKEHNVKCLPGFARNNPSLSIRSFIKPAQS
ncbi:radical SAM protein [Thermogladius sp. KZ2Tp1]|uniref:SPL family radical SAM protein n=1 Tax=Thermogladius sp. KZ2Tp1 TaxID=3136289 RepID=UPI003DA7DB7D